MDTPPSKPQSKLEAALGERSLAGLYRKRRITDTAQQAETIIDGQRVINFCSNDYLGFANHPAVLEAFLDGARKYGVGSGSAHLVSGHSRAHHQLEEELAAFTGYPRALLFSTGYMANLAVAQSLLKRGDNIFEDRLNHASLIDGGLLSGARFQRYRHNEPMDLSQKLANLHDKNRSACSLVCTDAVFSMDGDCADLAGLITVCQQSKSWLMIDDAHGFGSVGKTGKGSLQAQSVSTGDIPVYMATLGKAMGTAGAFVAGSEALIETLIQQARSYIYTTASPPAIAEATRCSLKLLQSEPQHVQKLHEAISYFRQCCKESSISLTDSLTAIQPIIIGDDKAANRLSQRLFTAGLYVSAIRPPTVPKGTARLRITLSAQHTHQHIDQLVSSLGELAHPTEKF